MARCLRLALLWLVMIALPVQGIAAANGMVCLPYHAMSEQAGTSGEVSLAPVASARGMPMGDMTPDSHDSVSAKPGIQPAEVTCGWSSVCLSTAALPTSTVPPEEDGSVIAPTSVLPRTPVAFFTDGPDRPPRRGLS